MRRKDAFDFKQFRIHHDRCTMKVGTDAVLLGAWVNTDQALKILDIGTGSGIIAIMLAQRTAPEVKIEAVELSSNDADQARENVVACPWPTKIVVHQMAIQNFKSDIHYDLIVSNPPFFSNSWLPPEQARQTVRHTTTLTHRELLENVNRLLGNTGKFAVVLPVAEGTDFTGEARNHHLFPVRQLNFFSREGKPQERVLVEFSREEQKVITEKLVLYSGGETWTAEYKKRMKDFYLHA